MTVMTTTARQVPAPKSTTITVTPPSPMGMPTITGQASTAPKGTPRAAIQKIHDALAKVSAVPENQKKLLDQGLEPWIGSSEEFSKFVISETARWKEVVTEAKIPKLK